jgi:hypothetical protein
LAQIENLKMPEQNSRPCVSSSILKTYSSMENVFSASLSSIVENKRKLMLLRRPE